MTISLWIHRDGIFDLISELEEVPPQQYEPPAIKLYSNINTVGIQNPLYPDGFVQINLTPDEYARACDRTCIEIW